MVNKEWLGCVVSRVTDFNNIYILKKKLADENIFKNLIINYFKITIGGYKGQGRKGGREIVDEYINENIWRYLRVIIKIMELNLILILKIIKW